MRSLVWLAMATNSSVIIPNLLGSEVGTDIQAARAVPLYKGQALYPAFRVTKFKRDKNRQQLLGVNVLEPGTYPNPQLDP